MDANRVARHHVLHLVIVPDIETGRERSWSPTAEKKTYPE